MYANQFSEILSCVSANDIIKQKMLEIISSASFPGKVTEEDERAQELRAILEEVTDGRITTLPDAYSEVSTRLPRTNSRYSLNNSVFASGWEERLIRTQLSRFYNQAVLITLKENGQSECFIPHSTEEDSGTQCSRLLAGNKHSIDELYNKLVSNYEEGNFSKEPKIPDHPHCTHVVHPIED